MLLVVTTLGFLSLAGVVQGQNTRNTSACYGRADCNSSVLLQCGADKRIFITKMLYGAKPKDSVCSRAPSCNTCCQPDVDDCFQNFTYNSESVYDACWYKQNCNTPASLGGLTCSGTASSSFSVLEYICLPAGLITEFHTNTSINASAVAVYYIPTNTSSYPIARGDNQTWHCQVDTADCVQLQVDVILVMENYPGTVSGCSRVEWSGGPFLPCVPTFQYKRVIATTPFYVSVLVDKSNRYPAGWAVVKAPDGSNIVVTCGYTPDATQDKVICPGSSTNTPITPATDMRTDATTTLSKALDTETTRTSKKATTTSQPSSSAVTSSAATAQQSQGSVMQGQSARNTSACFRRTDCTSSMTLLCAADQHVFITKMLYGVRRGNSTCSAAPLCSTCCQPDVSDCFREYTKDAESVYGDCWDKQRCTTPTHQAGLTCGRFTLSTFSVLEYTCLPAGLINEFHTNDTITGPAVAVRYDPYKTSGCHVVRGDNQTWHCQVDTADYIQRQADVILVKESYTVTTPRCSSVGWSGGPFLPCVPDFQYKRVIATTPFDVSVMVDSSNRFPRGWVLVRAQDGSSLAITCGYTSDPSTSPTVCEAPGPSLAPVVGGAVAGGLVLVAAVLAIVCCVRRTRGKRDGAAESSNNGKSAMTLTSVNSARPTRSSELGSGSVEVPGEGQPAISIHVYSEVKENNKQYAVDDDGTNGYSSAEEVRKSRSGIGASSGTHGGPRSPAEEPDYDLLGQKKSQSSSSNPAATYGRLGEVGGGGEDTYNYDRLARGRQAAPDVINSDYDSSSAPDVTSEGDYSVADFHKRKQYVITGSVYDEAKL